ncbi:YceD family protein [Halalkalibacter krulwichiae]|uniref:DUF177 domain-containing protein n=1 Tax=Halalkalibacter krulwichiae TaxID=199441 RepID=A0A1X9MF05_9BACI|nr:DUF177 domain-containing protein [Halalkalibacter krulwichiae]ARK31110.1 hypothetical protein BkAM31D_15340 [Halalkalibacter krulwichiae]
MKWSLQQLAIAKHKPFTFEETIELSNLKKLNPEIRSVYPVHVKGEVVYSGSLITFLLDVKGELILPCARTLADVRFSIDLQESVHFHPADEYVTTSVEQDDIHFFEGEMIDLIPAIEELILLEVPIQVFAEEGVEGPAPKSGKDWELFKHNEQKNRIDPRLADLAKFFEKE